MKIMMMFRVTLICLLLTFAFISLSPNAFASPCHIVICKVMVGSGPEQDFTFVGNLSADAFILQNETCTRFNLCINTYTVTELVPDGWKLQKILIDDPSGDSYIDGDMAIIRLGNEDVTVTFINTYVPVVGGTIIKNRLAQYASIYLLLTMLGIVGFIIACVYGRLRGSAQGLRTGA